MYKLLDVGNFDCNRSCVRIWGHICDARTGTLQHGNTYIKRLGIPSCCQKWPVGAGESHAAVSHASGCGRFLSDTYLRVVNMVIVVVVRRARPVFVYVEHMQHGHVENVTQIDGEGTCKILTELLC